MILILKRARPRSICDVPELHRCLVILTCTSCRHLGLCLGDPCRVQVARRTGRIIERQNVGMQVRMILIDMLDDTDQPVAEQVAQKLNIPPHPRVILGSRHGIGLDLGDQMRM